MRRRQFAKGLIALAGGLLVGDAALEAFDRLTHKKVWTGWDAPKWGGKGEYFDITKIHARDTFACNYEYSAYLVHWVPNDKLHFTTEMKPLIWRPQCRVT